MTLRLIALLAATALAPAVAAAHTPYLAPTTFAPSRDHVTVFAALTDSQFFVPDFPIVGGTDYVVTSSDGKVTHAQGQILKETALAEIDLPADGTYRISTGDREVRTLQLAQIDGKWRPVTQADKDGKIERPFTDIAKLAPGTKIVPVKTIVRADTYVSRGKPSAKTPGPVGKGVEVTPAAHPNEITAGDGLSFTVLFDGKPQPGADFLLFRAGDMYADKKVAFTAKTDASGVGKVSFDRAGAYVLEVERPWTAGDPADPKTYVYSLTFEVQR